MGVPQKSPKCKWMVYSQWMLMEKPTKMDDLGVPPF